MVYSDLLTEVRNLRVATLKLHLKHKSLAGELQSHRDTDARNKANLKRVKGSLFVAMETTFSCEKLFLNLNMFLLCQVIYHTCSLAPDIGVKFVFFLKLRLLYSILGFSLLES